MKIAILGWGSLIWDKRAEFDKWREDWQTDGPTLNLEFSRISKSRADALTLVIDEQHAEPCRVNYALSKRRNPDDTICDLKCREGTNLTKIGYHFSDSSRPNYPAISNNIKIWAKEKNLDVVVWTGLTSNFEETVGKEFSVPTALSHLKCLPPEGKAKAAEYIWRAPEFIQTPLRKAIEIEPWFARQNGA